VCSGHFHGGKKLDGDIPVADPDVDAPIRLDIPRPTSPARHSLTVNSNSQLGSRAVGLRKVASKGSRSRRGQWLTNGDTSGSTVDHCSIESNCSFISFK